MLVRPLAEADLDQADRIFRLAFGTFLGERSPARFGGDTDTIRTRWKADPAAAFAADLGGRLAGSNFAANWGTVGFFGPLTVTPKHWDQAIGQRLLDATMDLFAAWGTQHTGLFTFAHSAKHVGLYQKFGFWPRFLTAIMSRPVPPGVPRAGLTTLGGLPEEDRPGAVRAIADLTDAVYPGLDLSLEAGTVLAQRLGDVVLVDGPAGLEAAAVCHSGPGTEAGGGACYVKFGAVRPGPRAAEGFGRLLGRVRAAGRRPRRLGPAGRRERRMRPGLDRHDPRRIPAGHAGRGHAPAQRGRLPRQRPLRHRRLALAVT